MLVLHSACDGARRSRLELEGAMVAEDSATMNEESNSEDFTHSQANVSTMLSEGATVAEEKAPGDKCDCWKGSRPESCCQSSTYKMTCEYGECKVKIGQLCPKYGMFGTYCSKIPHNGATCGGRDYKSNNDFGKCCVPSATKLPGVGALCHQNNEIGPHDHQGNLCCSGKAETFLKMEGGSSRCCVEMR